MVTKNTATKKVPTKKVTSVVAQQEDQQGIKLHEIVLSSSIQASVGIRSWGTFAGEVDLPDLIRDLQAQTKQIQAGSMSSVEAMLYGQAKVLETMFTCLSRRAANNNNLKQIQVNLTLALKAQSQCRATLEALAEIKNPRPVQFVKQANMTTGPQQINNGSTAQSPAGISQSKPNKLLEANHGQRLDTRTQGQAGQVDQAVEAVEAIHRP